MYEEDLAFRVRRGDDSGSDQVCHVRLNRFNQYTIHTHTHKHTGI